MVEKPAGFWVRLGAVILDGIIIGIPLGILSFLITGDSDGDFFTNTLSFLYSILIPILWYGYTVGKRICGIRIVKVDGSKLGIGAMLLRIVVGGIIYGVTIGIAAIVSAIMVGVREDKRSIHDLIAGTYVTYEKP
ncbi:RDD family protein [Bacillus sp. FJAT-50079]|uniref:RDD family protein n=1 Tax=Bacillus sp. FJAT-50079 TaxID=2833577 RepID=UPI001BC9DA11|nr:RDD family protein [Bacillus sp. FJAT-50079]MBS4207865.1 RDD family protein [Bacillus sp. FJAT-50079]